MGKALLNRCTIHVTSPHEQLAIDRLIRPKHVFIIPNFIKFPVQQYINATRSGPELKLIFLSRIEEKKGLDILLNALPHVQIPYHLTIAGDGDAAYVDSLKQMARKNGLLSHISWAGFQGHHKFELLAEHDLLVLPSHDENFGNVVIESLSVGAAVLISSQVGLADYVRWNQLGWVCPPTASAFAGAIQNIDRKALHDIREKAPGLIYHDFNEHHLVKRYIDMYTQMIQHG